VTWLSRRDNNQTNLQVLKATVLTCNGGLREFGVQDLELCGELIAFRNKDLGISRNLGLHSL